MAENPIDAIIPYLPDTVIFEAACKYAAMLAGEGEIEKAEMVYDKLRALNSGSFLLAQLARNLIRHHISGREIEKAMRVYGNFPENEADCGIRGEKLQACHLLAHALLPGNFQKSLALWREFTRAPLNPALKWHWAQTAVALLDYCRKQDLEDNAAEIFGLLQKYGNCAKSQPFIEKAAHILAQFPFSKNHFD